MLFIEDNQPGIFERGKDRRARAENNLCLARFSARPGVESGLVGQSGVKGYQRHIKAIAKAFFSLRGKANLGN